MTTAQQIRPPNPDHLRDRPDMTGDCADAIEFQVEPVATLE